MTKVIGPMPVEDHYLWRRWTNLRTEVMHHNVISDWDKHDFWSFVDYVEIKVGTPPSKQHKLIRNRVDLGWVQGNLLWANAIEAGRHYRNAKLHKIGKETNTAAGWARKYNVNAATVYTRLEMGWPIKKAVGLQ
jgi:hypothetical protein